MQFPIPTCNWLCHLMLLAVLLYGVSPTTSYAMLCCAAKYSALSALLPQHILAGWEASECGPAPAGRPSEEEEEEGVPRATCGEGPCVGMALR